jgi:hypothetical protein
MEEVSGGEIQTIALARISHTFSEQIAALPIEIAFQVGEDSVHATRPAHLKGKIIVQSVRAVRESVRNAG